MKAIDYKGPFDVVIENVEVSKIESPLDSIVRITTSNICGSDLYLYEGTTSMDSGTVFGVVRCWAGDHARQSVQAA